MMQLHGKAASVFLGVVKFFFSERSTASGTSKKSNGKVNRFDGGAEAGSVNLFFFLCPFSFFFFLFLFFFFPLPPSSFSTWTIEEFGECLRAGENQV